jgi:hypothetical protein
MRTRRVLPTAGPGATSPLADRNLKADPSAAIDGAAFSLLANVHINQLTWIKIAALWIANLKYDR